MLICTQYAGSGPPFFPPSTHGASVPVWPPAASHNGSTTDIGSEVTMFPPGPPSPRLPAGAGVLTVTGPEAR